MVKLDVSLLRYLDKDDFRVLTAVEMGMRNHELVPRSLVYSISGINNGTIVKILLNLTQNKLLSYERGKRYDGYRLTYRGYDYLALNVLRTRGVISSIGNQIGVGKESDVYIASNDEGRQFAIKFHRLGRTCFRKVSDKRDYQKKGSNHKTASWLYLSRLAAIREYSFMKLLHERQLLPIPEPIDFNRHCIVMEFIEGCILNQISRDDFEDTAKLEKLYNDLVNMIMKLANEFGVVHGDFNEFNILMKTDTFEPVMIDFPQMVSVDHILAKDYFERDVICITNFFAKRFSYEPDTVPCFEGLEIQDGLNSDLKNIADILNDEDQLIKHLENHNNENNSLQNKSNLEKSSSFGPNEILSKFLNSLPNLEPKIVDDLYYEQVNDELVQQAQDKVELEKKLFELKLTNIDEQNENDENAIAAPIAPITDQQLANIGNLTNDRFETQSVRSHAYSTASTFSQQEVKSRLTKEKNKKDSQNRMKFNVKNIKGDSNAILRRKKNDQALANEDLKSYQMDSFW